jgi:hypothetical protein
MPVSTPLKLAEPGKNERQGPVRLVGLTAAVPVITKVPLVAVQLVTIRLRWQVNPDPAGAWTYCANWQSPSVPDVTPPANSHHPQNPNPNPVPGKFPVPLIATCQFALP